MGSEMCIRDRIRSRDLLLGRSLIVGVPCIERLVAGVSKNIRIIEHVIRWSSNLDLLEPALASPRPDVHMRALVDVVVLAYPRL